MERSQSERPRRPTRNLPELPIPPTIRTNTETSYASSHSESDAFSTPLASPAPSNNAELVESPIDEQPPFATEKQDRAGILSPQRDFTTLTPLRAHYLKKELTQLEFRSEFSSIVNAPLSNMSTLSYLGPPFTPPPKDGPPLHLPFLRYMFRQFVLSFPFLAAAPKDFFPDKLQPFIASLLSRNLTPTSVLDDNSEHAEERSRYKLMAKLERNFTMLLTSGIKIAEKEEVVRLTQSDLDRLERLAKRRAAREAKGVDVFDVNVVCIRTVVEKGRMRSKAHEEFIIRTRRNNVPDIFVSRRYGDFRTLAEELRKAHPSEVVPPPPPKDRTYVNVQVSTPPPSTTSLSTFQSTSTYQSTSLSPTPYVVRTSSSQSRIRQQQQYITSSSGSMPGMYRVETSGSQSSFDSIHSPTGTGSPGQGNGSMTVNASRLTREKNRLTLRSYLHTLLSSATLASSPVLRSFLLSTPTRLTEAEKEDAWRREEMDRQREDGRKRFAQEIRERVDGLRDAVRSVKGELLAKDGLMHVFATLKHTEDVRNLPDNYKAVLEWARTSLASTVYHHFVAADNASETFASLKRIHGLMPYFMLKAALKISNPMAMIRGVLDLFLAQPFGGHSLLQRMFTGSLMEEVKALEEHIEAVKAKVDDAAICEKVRLFVHAPREIQAIYKADAVSEKSNVLTVILRSGDQPALTRGQLQRVMRAHYAHREYVRYVETLEDSDDDEGPQNDDAWLYEDLTILAKLYSRLRDREQLIALIFEGSTAELLKDIITIFYAPLAQVYRAASIADSLGDLQNFLNDLIRTVEQSEEFSQDDPARTVQTFLDLIQRHEQSFYSFVHKVHSRGKGLFDELMRWIERFLTLMRDGLGDPISLEFVLPHTGKEREDILREVDEIARYHYKLKLAYEAKVRRRFGRTQGQTDADAEDVAVTNMVNDVVSDLSFGDLVKGDADDLAAENSDESDEGSSGGDDSFEDDTDESSGESGSSGSGSSGSGSETDRQQHREQTPMTRAQTIGHSPQIRTIPYPPLEHPKQSLDLPPSPSRPSMPPLMRSYRSMSIPSSSSKELPPLPMVPPRPAVSGPISARDYISPQSKDAPTSTKKKAKVEGPKPPELYHIPQLRPLFVEMMRPLLRPTPLPSSG